MKLLTKRRSRNFMIFGSIALFVGILVQLTGEEIVNPPVTAKIEAPTAVLAILKRSCFNCHSNETNLKWYDKIVPISFKVKADVDRAREVMNFSEWGSLSPGEQKGKFWAILNMIKAEKMPLKSYVSVHPEARVLESEYEIIKEHVLSLGKSAAPIGKVITENKVSPRPERVSPNGIPYSDDFKHWKVISMSTLYDNTMRVIYGNDIAVKAIEEDNFHPWPYGAKVVKAVWEQVENKYGEVRPGKFVNFQVMVKDAKKYTDTEGWGFAKFSSLELLPTGKTASFASKSCISCHRQLAEETGFLFNVPLKVNPKK